MQIALVGYGNMGKVHADNFLMLQQQVNVIEIDESCKQQAREKELAVFPSLENLLQSKKVDCVAICTPTYSHYTHIKEAMKHNVPIFVEKPIVLTARQADKLRHRMNQQLIFVGEVEHFNSQLSSALLSCDHPTKIVVDREVNLKFFIGNSSPWFLDVNQSGGIACDLMIHDIALLISKFGFPEIGKVTGKKIDYPCIDHLEAELVFAQFSGFLRAHWLRNSIAHPIKVKWCIFDQERLPHVTECKDYLNSEKIRDENPYYIQDQAFIEAAQTKNCPHETEIYLQAVEIACKINELIQLT